MITHRRTDEHERVHNQPPLYGLRLIILSTFLANWNKRESPTQSRLNLSLVPVNGFSLIFQTCWPYDPFLSTHFCFYYFRQKLCYGLCLFVGQQGYSKNRDEFHEIPGSGRAWDSKERRFGGTLAPNQHPAVFYCVQHREIVAIFHHPTTPLIYVEKCVATSVTPTIYQ